MFRKVLIVIKRFFLWDYPRASWQYDVMVAVILAFLFLTPRDWFRDQPRIPSTSKFAMLPGAHGGNVYWIESALLADVPEPDRLAKAGQMLRAQAGEKQKVVRLEPVFDSEQEIQGFLAFTRP